MIGERPPQQSLYAADALYLDLVGRDTFYGHLAQHRTRLFRDEDFADLYCPDNGRPSVPPSLLAAALLLQAHDKASDDEATRRAAFDLQWKVALGIEVEVRPFVKSTLQLFRSQLLIHDQARTLFLASLEEAKRHGFLKGKKRTLAVDTTPIFGKGAVQDTYNLLATGIQNLARTLAAAEGRQPAPWAAAHDLSRYFSSSLKGEAAINWDSLSERQALLASIVGDARRLLVLAQRQLSELGRDHPLAAPIKQSAELLCQLLAQDLESDEAGEPQIKKGVAKDRRPSASDPEMRHGRKSASGRFTGHKGAVAVDTEEGLIAEVDVIPGNAPDNQNALELTEGSERNTGQEVDKTIGDCAYGDGQTRQKFVEAERRLVAKVPRRPAGRLSKDEFAIDLTKGCVTCPAGHTVPFPNCWHRERQKPTVIVFPAALCAACPLRPQCVKAKARGGRHLSIHPQEELLQAARAYQATDEFRQDNLARQVVEHRLARLVQLGIRRSRFFGRAKTEFQLLMAATVANLTLVWNAAAQGAKEGACSLLSWLSGALTWPRRAGWGLPGRPLSPARFSRGSGAAAPAAP